jgi:hypothetical protein
MQVMAYENQKKTPALGLLLELFTLPGIGSLYGDHPQGALITWGGMIGGIVLAVAGANKLSEGDRINDESTRDTGGLMLTVGILSVIGFRVYGLVDSWQSCVSYNRELSKRLGLPPLMVNLAPVSTDRGLAWGPALQLRF